MPIFPSYDSNFNCTFYLISETKTAYMKTQGAPKEFGDCCILADNFHAPVRNFSENTNFTGVKDFGPNQYLAFEVDVPTAGGIFSYNFWRDAQYESLGGERYYVPSFFYYTGVTPNPADPNKAPMPIRSY